MLSVIGCNLRTKLVVVVFLALLVFLSPSHASAQFTTASLGGTVRDSSGGAVPDAAVSIVNVATGFSLDVRTNGAGAFLFSRVPVGTYLLRVAHDVPCASFA